MDFSFQSFLSEPRFDAMDFSDVTTLGHEGKLAVMECMSHALVVFLEKIGFKYKPAPRDEPLRHDLWTWSAQNLAPLCVCDDQVLDRVLGQAVSCVEYYYPLSHHDSRLQMAIGLAVTIGADDNVTGPETRRRFDRFQYDLWQGSTKQDEWARMCAGFIKDFAEHFGAKDPRVGSLGANGWATFMEASFTEDTFAKKLPPHLSYVPPRTAAGGFSPSGFASFFRFLTGEPIPFMLGIFKPSREIEVPLEYWMTSIPNLVTYIDLINDLLSWPKEVMAEETYNYVSIQTLSHRRAKTTRITAGKPGSSGDWTFRDTICETMDTLYQATLELDWAFLQFAR